MYFKDTSGAVHFLEDADIENGRTFGPVPKIGANGLVEQRQAHDGISGELLFEVDGTTPIMEPVYVIEEGRNAVLALLPPDCVTISDEEAYSLQHPPETIEQASARLLRAVDARIDATAAAKGYEVARALARAGYVNPFQAECIAFATWVDSQYIGCFGIRDAVLAGTRPLPSEAELLAELPEMVWPQ